MGRGGVEVGLVGIDKDFKVFGYNWGVDKWDSVVVGRVRL